MSALTGIRPRQQQQAKPGVPDVHFPSNISPLPPGGTWSIQARWDTYIIPPVSSGSSPSWPCPEDLNEEASSLIRCPDHLGREKWSWWMAEQCWSDWKQGCIERCDFSFCLMEIELNVTIQTMLMKKKSAKHCVDSDCNVMVVIVHQLLLLYRYTVIENPDKTVGGKFSCSVERTHNFFTGGVHVWFVSSPWFTTKMESNWDFGAVDNGRRSQKLFRIFVFQSSTKKRRSDSQSRYACRSGGTKEKKKQLSLS